MPGVSDAELAKLRALLIPLVGLRINWLAIPLAALSGFEPSQLSVLINTILDGALPNIHLLAQNGDTDPDNVARLREVGLAKSPGEIGEREGYPDYVHSSGFRVELKGLFVDNPDLPLKRPPTRREPSARIKDNVTIDVVDSERDVLAVVAAQLESHQHICSPVIRDIGLFSIIDVVRARDESLIERGGKWIGNIPMVVSKDKNAGFKHDTNFGKLKRIPYEPLQQFMRRLKTI